MLLVMRSEDISLYVYIYILYFISLYFTGNYLKFSIVILNNINEYLFSVLNKILFYFIL